MGKPVLQCTPRNIFNTDIILPVQHVELTLPVPPSLSAYTDSIVRIHLYMLTVHSAVYGLISTPYNLTYAL